MYIAGLVLRRGRRPSTGFSPSPCGGAAAVPQAYGHAAAGLRADAVPLPGAPAADTTASAQDGERARQRACFGLLGVVVWRTTREEGGQKFTAAIPARFVRPHKAFGASVAAVKSRLDYTYSTSNWERPRKL